LGDTAWQDVIVGEQHSTPPGQIRAIGLDLGSANVRVAVAAGSQANLVTWPEGVVCPAALSIASGRVLFGHEALERMGTHPQSTVLEPLALAGGRGTTLDGQPYAVEQLLAFWFERAARAAGMPGHEPRFVACVSWDAKQTIHPTLVSAASRAGVQLMTTIQPTVAAAVGHASIRGMTEGTFLVVDVGARKLEVALVRIRPGATNVLARAQERAGGTWVDESLADACLRELFPGLDPRRLDPARRTLIRLESERVRRQLGEQTRVLLHVALVPGAAPGSGPMLEVTRRRLDDLMKPLQGMIAASVQGVMQQAQLKPGEIDDVVAVGGISHMHHVTAVLREVMGRAPAPTDIDGATARGAAIVAANMAGVGASPESQRPSQRVVQDRPSQPSPAGQVTGSDRPASRPSPAKNAPTQPAMRFTPPGLQRTPVSATCETQPAMHVVTPASGIPSARVYEPSPTEHRVIVQEPTRRKSRPGPVSDPAPDTRRASPVPAPRSQPAPAPTPSPLLAQGGPSAGAHPTMPSARIAEQPLAKPDEAASSVRVLTPSMPATRESVQTVIGAARASVPPEIRESAPPEPRRREAEEMAPATPSHSERAPTHANEAKPPPMSVPVPGSRGSMAPGVAVPLQGSFAVPRTAADLLRMPLRRPITHEDLNPIWLPALFISLSRRKDLSGVLELKREIAVIKTEVVQGGVLWQSARHKDSVLAGFAWERGTYDLQVRALPKQPEGKPESLSKLAIEGIRAVLREESEANLVAALGEKMEQAPKVSSRGLGLAEVVGFWTAEKRFLKYHCDGSLCAQDAMKSSGVSRATAMQVVFVLDLFGEVDWSTPIRKSAPSLAEQVGTRAKEAALANHFELLGVHWSASERDVQAAYERFIAEYGPGTEAAKAASDAANSLLKAASLARDTLMNRGTRIAYLQKVKPDLDFLALAELLKTRSDALELRGSDKEARASSNLLTELDPLAKAAAARVIDVSKIKKGDS
jgi:actin-like ATPase involved in cell morphogenesis